MHHMDATWMRPGLSVCVLGTLVRPAETKRARCRFEGRLVWVRRTRVPILQRQRETLGENVLDGRVYRDGYCDMQPWARAAPYCSA